MRLRSVLASIIAPVIMVGCGQPPIVTPPRPATAAPLPTTAKPTPPPPVPRPTLAAAATIRDLAGTRVGTVTFADSYAGVIVTGNITGLGLGAHAIHVHETGKCQSPFTTAGGHFNPHGKRHGFLSPDGSHVGDLPNIDTPAAGRLRFEFLMPGATLRGSNGILDADGAAIVIHGSRDDYYSDPSGNSGSRIACGVITIK